MSKPTPPAYKTRNWPAYSEPLMLHWFEQPPAVRHRFKPDGGGERAPLRQTTGFVESLLRLIDLDWPVPNFSTLSRRQRTLKVNIPVSRVPGPAAPPD